MAQCKLVPAPAQCTADVSAPLPDVTYDTERCAPARTLVERGIPPSSDLGVRIYRFLGRTHRVVYRVEGTIPLSVGRLRFLVDDLPLAAKLVSRFQPRTYTAQYLDPEHRRFHGAKGQVVEGDVELVSGSAAEGRVIYFGLGTSKVAFWRLRGRVLTDIVFRRDPATPGATWYRVDIVSSPENGTVNRIMSLGLFRSVVQRHLREVLTDVTEAAHKLEAQGAAVLGDWPADDQARVSAFLRIP